MSIVNTDTIFVDIGANIGIATCLIANKCKFCLSVEPCTSTFIQLVKNINKNKLKNVIPIKALIDNKSGIESMTSIPYSGINQKIEHIKDNPYINEDLINNNYEKVLAITLDTLLVDFLKKQFIDNKNINLVIKLDVERNELNVLRGAHKLLNLDIPIFISLESYSKKNLYELDSYLSNYGFKKFKTKLKDSNSFYYNFNKQN